MLEVTANPNRKAVGTVLEASLDKGRGYVAKVLVQTGTLKIGDPIVSGEHAGKVKAMFNERGKRILKAGPSAPLLVLGLSGAPQAGERFKVADSESDARQYAAKRAQIAREQTNRASKRISLEEIGRRLALGNFKELNLIVKGDVDGSVEALSDSLIKLSIETIQVNVIHSGVGQIVESDVLLASASDAIIIGFQVRPSLGARKLAEREGVEIKLYSIIYEAIEEVRAAIEGMLEPTKEEKIVCNLEVREVYKISKLGTIAGCIVQEGKIARSTNVRIIRDGIVIFPTKEGVKGELGSLKRFKDDVKEVKIGMECGVTVKNFNDIKVGDQIEGFEIIEIRQTSANSMSAVAKLRLAPFETGVWLFCFSLPLWPRLAAWMVALVFVSWLFQGDWRNKGRRLAHPVALLLPTLFFLYLLGMAFTENRLIGWQNVGTKLSLLIFPLVLLGTAPEKLRLRQWLHAFVAGCLVAVIYSLCSALWVYFSTGELYFSYTRLGSFLSLHPTYFSLYISLSIFVVVLEKNLATWQKVVLAGTFLLFFFCSRPGCSSSSLGSSPSGLFGFGRAGTMP
ncbi:MAG: hypothetical protein IPJ40_11075 [Saprospirales bacterium]|nr:hypothetical protein [Saprospirales bacterium]